MLILSRGLNESIWIYDDIKITVIEITKSQIKLGFTAPLDVPITRDEIMEDQPDDLKLKKSEICNAVRHMSEIDVDKLLGMM